MESNVLISVIIPVYKVEEFLPECIESVMNQTYNNLEIILVDDGSPDNCPQICESYAKKDKRIKVLHKKNGGVSEARNVGLTVAIGEYITFIDSDDYVAEEYLEQLYINLKGCDVSECGIGYLDEDGIKSSKSGNAVVLDWKTYLTETNLNGFLSYAVVWGKLYKRELFSNIFFPIGRANGEDEATAFKLVYEAQRVSRIYEPLYYYRQRQDSASKNNITEKRIKDTEYLFDEKILFFDEKHEDDMVVFFSAKKAVCFASLYKNATELSIKIYCRKIVKELLGIFLFKRVVPIKYKIYVLFFILTSGLNRSN